MVQVGFVNGNARPEAPEEVFSLNDFGFRLHQKFHGLEAPPGEFDTLLSQEDLARRQRHPVSSNLKSLYPIRNLVLDPGFPHVDPTPATSVRRIVYRFPNFSQLFIAVP